MDAGATGGSFEHGGVAWIGNRLITSLAAAGLILGAVGAAPVAAQDATTAPMAPAVPTVPTGYTELDQALTPAADGTLPFAGKTVDIQVQWTGGELTNFQNSMADFAKATGITIQVDSVPSSHETVLKSRIEGGAPPDIAQLAQPTPVLAYAAEGKVIDVATFMDAKKLSTSIRRPSAWSRRTTTSGASRTRPTSSRRSGIPSRRSPRRATRSRRRGMS